MCVCACGWVWRHCPVVCALIILTSAVGALQIIHGPANQAKRQAGVAQTNRKWFQVCACVCEWQCVRATLKIDKIGTGQVCLLQPCVQVIKKYIYCFFNSYPYGNGGKKTIKLITPFLLPLEVRVKVEITQSVFLSIHHSRVSGMPWKCGLWTLPLPCLCCCYMFSIELLF